MDGARYQLLSREYHSDGLFSKSLFRPPIHRHINSEFKSASLGAVKMNFSPYEDGLHFF